MDASESGEEIRQSFQVAYFGSSKDDHSIDVEALAPALLGFGKLIREANATINGSRAKVKLLVTSDFEHKCFQINFETIQVILETLKSLLADDKIENIKEILKALGMIGTGAGSLFAYLKWKNGKEIKSIGGSDSSGNVAVTLKGNNNTIQIHQNVLMLSENPKVLKAVDETLEPIEKKEAESIQFKHAEKDVAKFEKKDIEKIIASCRSGPDLIAQETNLLETPETVTASLHVYSPVYDAKAKTWRFNYKRGHIYADISETSIAKDAIRRGGSLVNDRYKVKMEISPPESDGGSPSYKIKEVLEFDPAHQQTTLKLPKPKSKAGKK